MKVNGVETYAIKDISDKMNVPIDVIKWNIETFAEKDGIKKGVHYFLKNRSYVLTAPALLWFICKANCCDVNAYEGVGELFTNEMEDMSVQMKSEITQLKSDNAALVKERDKTQEMNANLLKALNDSFKKKEAFMESFNSVIDIVTSPNGIINQRPAKPKKTLYKKNAKNLPELSSEESEWENSVTSKIKSYVSTLDNGQTFLSTLRSCYGIMTREYGVVFKQEKKDLHELFNIDEDEHISTLRVITYNPRLRNLLMPILDDIINGTREI